MPKPLACREDSIYRFVLQAKALGLRPNKAAYIFIRLCPDGPKFPLDAELIAQIPRGVPGKFPRDALEYLNLLIREPKSKG
jgi:hypothetical protein